MADIIEEKFNYFLQTKNLKKTHRLPQCKAPFTFSNNSLFITRRSSILSSSTVLHNAAKSNDVSSIIYAVTIIIFFAAWTFRKTTYVKHCSAFFRLWILNRVLINIVYMY